jgi:uncharacterized protein (TIGR00730 family)
VVDTRDSDAESDPLDERHDPDRPPAPEPVAHDPADRRPSLLEQAAGVESAFLQGRQENHDDLESAVRYFLEFLRGFEFMQMDRPCVTVFGSARFCEGHPYYEQARELGRHLASHGYAVMTGGGPGIMEAANRGCKEAGGLSIGCNITLPREQKPNPYLDRYMEFEHFFVRKVMLVKYSCAFAVLPGGFGTLDEVFETITLMQTDKIESFPVVCIGGEFWRQMRGFFDRVLVTAGTITRADLELIEFADTVEQACTFIRSHPRGCERDLR